VNVSRSWGLYFCTSLEQPRNLSPQQKGSVPQAHDHIVLFDGVCNLCNGFVQFIIRNDKRERFHFGALQSAEAFELLKGSSIRPSDLDTVIYLRKGKALTRSTAALQILKELGGAWSLMAVFFVVPRFLRDAVYRFIGNNRYRWFGRQESCMLPTPELRARFLDGLGR
jgi:predicted DCC family thiol-disulfide oxidoreductase YuxK